MITYPPSSTQRTTRQGRSNPWRGFTLLELVIAIAILGIIMTVAYSSLSAIMRSKAGLDDGREADLVANAVLLRLTRELSLASVKFGMLHAPYDPNNNNPPAPNVTLMGSQKTLMSGQRGDSISFLASEAGQYLPDGGTHVGVVQLTYRATEDPEKRTNEDETFMLLREEMPYVAGSRPRSIKKLMAFPVTTRLRTLQFEYYDQQASQWVEEWPPPSSGAKLSMIRFSLTLRSPQGVDRSYSSIVAIR